MINIDEVNQWVDPRNPGGAEAWAVLALAEQQRTANLLTYLAICESRGAKDEAYQGLDFGIRTRLGLK